MPVLVGIGGWIAEALLSGSIATVLRGIAGLILRQLAIKAILLAVWAAIWVGILSFSQEVFAWFIETAFSVLEWAMVELKFPDIFLALMKAIEGVPERVLAFVATIGIFDSIDFLLSCLFANRALRAIPIIGRAFGG